MLRITTLYQNKMNLNIMGEIIDIFSGRKRELNHEQKAHLIQRITDLAIEIALLQSEKERLEGLFAGERQ